MIQAALAPASDAPPADSIRATLGQVFQRPEFRWGTTEIPGFIAWLQDTLRALNLWLDRLMLDHPVLGWLFLAGLVLLATALVVHLGYLVWRGIASARENGTQVTRRVADVQDAAWHLREARRLRDAGRITEALGHRFVALLLELERRKALKYHPSKTPAEYAREARLAPEGQALLSDLVGRLYRFLFRGDTPTADDFDVFDGRARELGAQVATG